MQITDQGSENIFMKERERKKRVWEDTGMQECMHVCLSVYFFFFWIAADLELAEEDGIVRIRRRDFTKRRLPMCNSFWRPWNCYCEKFSSCKSSTESPQIGRIQPPPLQPPTPPTPPPRSSEAWLHESRWGCECSGLGFLWILQLLKIFEPLWGMGDISHSLMALNVHP